MAFLKKLKDTAKEVVTLGIADTQTYNSEDILRKKIEKVQGVSLLSSAPKTPQYGNTYQPTPTPKYTPNTSKFVPQNGSNVSSARLDYISPKMGFEETYKNELEKNKTLLKELYNKGQITPEDEEEINTQKTQGVPREIIYGKMLDKKRYQIGTRQFAPETINKNNVSEIFAPSEIKSYLQTKKPTPEQVQYAEELKSQGITGDEGRKRMFQEYLKKDIEDEIYSKYSKWDKFTTELGQTLGGTGVELVATVPHLAAFLVNSATWDGLEENKVGRFINKKTDELTRKSEQGMGMDTGDFSGNQDNSLIAGKVISTLLPFLWGQGELNAAIKSAQVANSTSKLAQFPKLVRFLQALSYGKQGAKDLKWYQRLGAAALRNGLFTVGASALSEGKAPTPLNMAIGTGGGMALEGAFVGGGRLFKEIGAKVGVAGLFKFGARKRLARELAEEGEVGTIDDIFKWLKDRGLNKGNEDDMVANLTKHTEESYQATNIITKKMDEAGVIIKDEGYITGALKKIRDKLKGSESPEQIAKLNRVEELLAKAEKQGGLIPTEANEVKRLLDENLDMFTMDGFVKKPQADNVALRSGVRRNIEKEGEKLGFDVRAINAETSVSRKIKDAMLDKMLSDNIMERAILFTGKNIIRGGLGLGVGPFDNNTTEGKIGNFLLGVGAGYVSKPFVKNQAFKNWISRVLTAFSKKEIGALEQFRKSGKTTPEAERIIREFVEKMRRETPLLEGPSGKPLSPSEVDIMPQTGYSPGNLSKNERALTETVGKEPRTLESFRPQPSDTKLLPPDSNKYISPAVSDVKTQTGYSPGVLQKNNEALGTMPRNGQESRLPDQTPIRSQQSILSKLSKRNNPTKPSSVVGKETQRGLTEGSKSIPGKKVNNPIIQKIGKKQETPKIDPELESLQKSQESLPGLPKVEVPADYVPKDGLPTGTEFESTILPTKTKTNKIPSPDVKRPQIRGIDLGIRSNMIDSLKQEGIFTDSFFAITDKNLSKKFIDYAEQKAIKKGISTSGKEVSIRQLLDTAKNSADTVLTPTEYVKGLDGDKGIYLRFDISDGNKVAINSSYADIFFKNFDDVTFKGSNEVSPVIVYSKGKDVGVIMPIKDPYGAKEVLGDFAVGKPKIPTPKTPQVEGKTALPMAQKSNGIDAITNEAKKYKTEAEFIDSLKKKMSNSILPDDFYPKKYELPKDGGMGRAEALIKSTEERLAQSKKELSMARNKNRIAEIERSIKRTEEELQTKIDDLNRYNNEKKAYDDALDRLTNKDKVDAVIRNGKATESDRELLTFMLENRDKPVEFWTDIYKQSKPKPPLPLSSKSEVKYSKPKA